MKKTIAILPVVAMILAGMTLFSCGKEEETTNNPGGTVIPDEWGGEDTLSDKHAYVDFHLPSGTLWGTCNVGATNPEDYGGYFAWGETETKSDYNWGTYRYCNGNFDKLTKYCSTATYGNNGFTDTLTVLQPSDDAATAKWGSKWHTPTKTQWDELLSSTTQVWDTVNGVAGCMVKSNDGNDSIFLPATGVFKDEMEDVGVRGYYFSASLSLQYPYSPHYYMMRPDNYATAYGSRRCFGFSVRPVRAAVNN